MSAFDVARAREIVEAATPGPWTRMGPNVYGPDKTPLFGQMRGTSCLTSNVQLAAEARTLLPMALDALQERDEERARLRPFVVLDDHQLCEQEAQALRDQLGEAREAVTYYVSGLLGALKGEPIRDLDERASRVDRALSQTESETP